jgi:hypothetical protein
VGCFGIFIDTLRYPLVLFNFGEVLSNQRPIA